MSAQLRDLVARALYPTKSYNLPAVTMDGCKGRGST